MPDEDGAGKPHAPKKKASPKKASKTTPSRGKPSTKKASKKKPSQRKPSKKSSTAGGKQAQAAARSASRAGAQKKATRKKARTPSGPAEPPAQIPAIARLPDDPSRWTRGDWEWDPENDPDWEDPTIWRRRIATPEELEAVADAVVRGHALRCTDPDGNEREIVRKDADKLNGVLTRYAWIEELQNLIEQVQRHNLVRLARIETEVDADGFLRVTRRWVTDIHGEEVANARPTEIAFDGTVVELCDVSNLDIAVTLVAQARFDGEARFNKVRFAGKTWFDRARFAGIAWFHGVRFTGTAGFDGTSFAKMAWLHEVRFAGMAWIQEVRFAGTAWITDVRFAGEARFNRTYFTGIATLDGSRFAEMVRFDGTRFTGEAGFANARFARTAWFAGAHFGGLARFDGPRFVGEAWFDGVRFDELASFHATHIQHALVLTNAQFQRALRFDNARFTGSAWMGNEEDLQTAPVPGLYLSESTSYERIVLRGARFSPRARLGIHGLLCLGDSTLEVDEDLIRPLRLARRFARRSGHNSLHRRLRAIGHDILHYLGLVEPPAIICCEDMRDPDALRTAARDWELIAHNAGRQSGTDPIEDWSRWRANECRRKADWFEGTRTLASLPPPPPTRANPPLAWMIAREFTDIAVVMGSVSARFLGFFVRDVLWRWLIERTMVAYMLDPRRIVASGAGIMLCCALIFGAFASERTIGYMGELPEPYADAIAYWHAPDLWGLDLSPLYFSMMTFVTLGYGDFAPIGWFKIVAAAEALLGVTLLALFTVAWGRRMIR